MNKLGRIRAIKDRDIPNDIFNTPLAVVQKMILMADITETDMVLDPCKGEGIIFNNLPPCIKNWCEILEGRDFFDYDEQVDVIVANPPFSLLTRWLQKSIVLNPKIIVLVMGLLNLTVKRLHLLEEHGYYLKKMEMVNIRGWFGTSIIVLFEKGGESIIEYNTEWYGTKKGNVKNSEGVQTPKI